MLIELSDSKWVMLSCHCGAQTQSTLQNLFCQECLWGRRVPTVYLKDVPSEVHMTHLTQVHKEVGATNANSREQTEPGFESFQLSFISYRFIPTKCMQYIPADIRFNICSHYVSPSIFSLWQRVWKASWICIFQIYNPFLNAADIRAEPSELY